MPGHTGGHDTRRLVVCSPPSYNEPPCEAAHALLDSSSTPLAYWSGFLSLIILLLLSSGTAYAEWVSVGTTDDGMIVYADPDTIRRKGDLVKMWELYDYKTAQVGRGSPFLSSRQQSEYDCAEESNRVLTFRLFMGNMGSGKVSYSSLNEGMWEPVEPDSIGKKLWTVACGKK